MDIEQRRRCGRIGGLTRVSRYSPAELTAAASRGFEERFRRLVDPDGTLSPDERDRPATAAKRAHMLTLAEASAAARRAKKSPAPSDVRAGLSAEATRDGIRAD